MIYGDNLLQLSTDTYAPNIYAIMQSGNLYAYTMNNLIAHIDPTGFILQIQGDEKQKDILFSALKELAGGYRIYMNDKGIISMTNAPKNSTPQSRNLIQKLINSKYTIIIQETIQAAKFETGYGADDWGRAANSKKGSGGTIYMNFTEAGRIGNTSYGCTDNSPFFICLGHELIHAERAARGAYIPSGRTASESEGMIVYKILIEEYATMGLRGYNKKGDITENMLRAEHGFPLRTRYRTLP